MLTRADRIVLGAIGAVLVVWVIAVAGAVAVYGGR